MFTKTILRSPSESKSLKNNSLWFTAVILFVLFFPKAGIKVGGIPLTWGYLILSLISINFLFRKKWIVSKNHFLAFIFQIPFQCISLIAMYLNGIEHTQFAIAFFVNFIFFPFLILSLFSEYVNKFYLSHFYSLLKKGILFVSIFGIFLFFFKFFTGYLIKIPFLTLNYHDINTIEFKCNQRGDLFKLISTYNNGNLYGICILMILPLYQIIENKSWKHWIVKLSLLLTLSRTVWVGLFVCELLMQMSIKNLKNGKLINILIKSIPIFIFIIIFVLREDISFIFDTTLGGRSKQFDTLFDLSFLGHSSFAGIGEIVYLGILKYFGVIGLIFFLGAMLAPLFIAIRFLNKENCSIRKSIFKGLLLYLFIACGDGAILLIPVMAFYWFLSALLLANRELAEVRG